MNEFKVKHGLIVDGALSASFAYTTASAAVNAATASFVIGNVSSATFATSASWASSSYTASFVTASNVQGAVLTAQTAYVANAINFVPVAATSASWVSASAFITTAQTASYVLAANVSGKVASAANADIAFTANYATQSLNATSSISASFATTSANLIGWNFVNTGSVSQSLVQPTLVVGLSTGSYLAAFFDYAAASGSNVRAGTIFGSWAAGSISYSEVCNVDVGNTNDVTMSLGIAGDQIQLSSSVNVTAKWNIRALARFV